MVKNVHTQERQLDAADCMRWMSNYVKKDRDLMRRCVATMGITMVDITKGDWNFVYGLADLMEGIGCFSLARFSPEFNHETITVRSGTRVQLQGLQNRPELNGMTGIISNFDAVSARYAVELCDSRTMGLQLSNLQTSADAGAASLLDEERRLLILERAAKVPQTFWD